MRRSRCIGVVALGLFGGCGSSVGEHCEARQAYWEHAFADEDPAWAHTTREQLVPSCKATLSNKPAELACRGTCLRHADKSTPRGSQAARDAYAAFSRCEAACLGGEGGPRPVAAP